MLAFVLASSLLMAPTPETRVVYRFEGEKYMRVWEPPIATQQAVRVLGKQPKINFTSIDQKFPHQAEPYHIGKVNASLAWKSYTGIGVVVAVLDSGVSSPILQPSLVPGWNFLMQSDQTADDNGHGTAVAGCVFSMAPGAKIMPVKVAGADGNAWTSSLYNGLVWAADHGARVANMSYMVSSSSLVRAGMQYFATKGGVCTVSAGNYNTRDANPDNPYCLTVSATDASDNKASWSCYGPVVDICAPGVNITTTNRGGGYVSWSGTSFSAPIVAGAVALQMQAYPKAAFAEIQEGLKKASDDLGAKGWDEIFGAGRLNIGNAVPKPVPVNVAPTAVWTSGTDDFGDTATWSGVGYDDKGVVKTELWINGRLRARRQTPNFSATFYTTYWGPGIYQCELRAFDAEGLTGSVFMARRRR